MQRTATLGVWFIVVSSDIHPQRKYATDPELLLQAFTMQFVLY